VGQFGIWIKSFPARSVAFIPNHLGAPDIPTLNFAKDAKFRMGYSFYSLHAGVELCST